MTVELNHTIVPASDKVASAQFLAGILGVAAGPQWGPFVPLKLDNGVTLDFDDQTGFAPHHYAFLVSDEEFDAGFARIEGAGIDHYADPMCQQVGEINHAYGGRGVYFRDPDGHLMELITQPYGDGPPR